MTVVGRRRVFHLAGYDPRGAGYYRLLYRNELRTQSAVNGLQARIEALGQAESWRIVTPHTVTDYSILAWEDLVMAHWRAPVPVLYGRVFAGFFALLRGGGLALAWRRHPRLFATLVYPLALTLGALVLGLAVAGLFWGLGGRAGGFLALAALATPLVLLPLAEKRSFLFWLARIFDFMARRGAGATPALDSRLDDFARRIAADPGFQSADEVLLLGHSFGADLAVSVTARLMAMTDRPIALVTMGHLLPLAAGAAEARGLRDELSAVSAAPQVHWIDVTSTLDWFCLPNTDPVAASGAAPGRQPLRVPARFHTQFRPETLRPLKRQFMRMHLQYLMAAEQPGGFDLFAITAGPQPLTGRYPAKSELDL